MTYPVLDETGIPIGATSQKYLAVLRNEPIADKKTITDNFQLGQVASTTEGCINRFLRFNSGRQYATDINYIVASVESSETLSEIGPSKYYEFIEESGELKVSKVHDLLGSSPKLVEYKTDPQEADADDPPIVVIGPDMTSSESTFTFHVKGSQPGTYYKTFDDETGQ